LLSLSHMYLLRRRNYKPNKGLIERRRRRRRRESRIKSSYEEWKRSAAAF
jgi:hypothetical protein